MTVGLPHFLVVSVLLLAAGIVTMVVKRHAIGVLMGVTMMGSAAALNFVAFNAYLPTPPGDTARVDGIVFALFIIVLGAAQVGLGVSLVMNLRGKEG